MANQNKFHKVASGEKMEISADTYNAMVDAAQAHRSQNHNLLVGGRQASSGASIEIKIRNNSGVVVPSGGVLGLDGVDSIPNANSKPEKLIYTGSLPTEQYRLHLAIAKQAIAAESVGKATILHLANAMINVPAGGEDCQFAGIAIDQTGYLQARSFGQAKILWKDTSSSTTGQMRAIVMLGDHPSVFSLAVDVVSGSTYQAKDPISEESIGDPFQKSTLGYKFMPVGKSVAMEWGGNGIFNVNNNGECICLYLAQSIEFSPC